MKKQSCYSKKGTNHIMTKGTIVKIEDNSVGMQEKIEKTHDQEYN
jgi:hypothetical protein